VPSADLNFQTAKVVIARSEATKQSIITVALAVDCFASLAMTVVVASLLAMTARLRDLAARFRPSFASSFAALRTEGAGNAGRSMHPQPRVRMKKAHEQVTTVTPEITRDSPRNGFTAYIVLSPATNSFLSPSPAD